VCPLAAFVGGDIVACGFLGGFAKTHFFVCWISKPVFNTFDLALTTHIVFMLLNNCTGYINYYASQLPTNFEA